MSDPYKQSLEAEVASGGMTQAQMDDLLSQKSLFDANRPTIEATHKRKFVGFAGDQMFIASSLKDLKQMTQAQFPDRLFYFETVGFSLFG
ncbi:MAG: hypothetical protein P4L53_04745 [Candidatus Obscuribacterales bacterium]|nr:hypothetical protein [Candidatus Obscuribacterales bacterium]